MKKSFFCWLGQQIGGSKTEANLVLENFNKNLGFGQKSAYDPPPLLGHCDNVMETKTSMTCNISCNQLLNFCLRRLVFIVQNTFTPRPPNAHMDHRMCIVLLCLLRLPSSIHAYSHWSHLLGFSPLCVIICFLRLLFPMDV